MSERGEPTLLAPEIDPYRHGHLRVSATHEIYWELCGNPDGIPVIVLHGGPGGGASPMLRRFFDAERFHMLLFDQRGAARSRPRAQWRDNTTSDLVADIETLRDHLGMQRPAILFGGSWGSTLALVYAEAWPEHVRGLVLRGIFLGRRRDIDHFLHGGAGVYYPEVQERLRRLLPRPDELSYADQLFQLMTEGDEAARAHAIREFGYFELRMSQLDGSDAACEEFLDSHDVSPTAILESHYLRHDCFLEDDQILRDIDRIAHLPTCIVNGRHDVICPPAAAHELAGHLRNVRLRFPVGAHSFRDPRVADALIEGTEWVAGQQ